MADTGPMVPRTERMARGWSLTRRLVVALSAGAFFVALVLGFLGSDREGQQQEQARAALERALLQSLAERAGPLLDRDDRLRLSVLAAVVRDQASGRALVLDRAGKVIIDTALALGERQLGIVSANGPFQRTIVGPGEAELRESIAPVRFGGEVIGEVRLHCEPWRGVGGFDLTWFGLVFLSCLTLVVVAAILGHHWTTRVRGATDALIRLAAGEVVGHEPDAREGELQDLGLAMKELERGVQDGLQSVVEGYVGMALQVVEGLERNRLVPPHHGERTARLAGRLAERLQLLPADRNELDLACRLVDLGKAWMRPSLLQKTGPLSDVEAESLRHHPVRAAEQLECLPGLRRVGRIVRHQMERFAGDGSPDGLRKERIPLGSRVLAIASAFDLLTAGAGEHSADWRLALERLRQARGEVFDPWLVDLFAEEIEKDPPARIDRDVMIVPSGAVPWRTSPEPGAEDDDQADELDSTAELEVMLDDRREEKA